MQMHHTNYNHHHTQTAEIATQCKSHHKTLITIIKTAYIRSLITITLYTTTTQYCPSHMHTHTHKHIHTDRHYHHNQHYTVQVAMCAHVFVHISKLASRYKNITSAS